MTTIGAVLVPYVEGGERPPRLAPGVVVVEPLDVNSPWIIQDGPQRYFRVSPDFAAFARALDGRTPVADLVARLGSPWTTDNAEQVLARLDDFGLSGDREEEPARAPSRFRYVPPLTVQFNVVDPAKLLAPLAGLIRVVMGRAGLAVQAAIACCGLAVLALRPTEVWIAATTPLPLLSYGAVALAFVFATAIHEFGHGAVLTGHGGRPSRMGVMLFYLAPAFFCDVSDGWRLPHRWQRVQIAFSGISTQAVVGGAAALASGLPAAAPIRNELILFAAGAYLGGLLNLIPFVKFDGYLALMSHVDIPGLRDKAMTDARQFLAWLLLGARREPLLPDHRWAVAYGLGCLVFPFIIVAQAVSLWSVALAQIGILGLIGMVVGIIGGALVLGRGWVRIVRHARDHGGSHLRVIAVTALLLGSAGATACLVQVPRVVQGGYFTGSDQVVHFILPAALPDGSMAPGDPVDLFRSGVFGRQQIGTGVIADPSPVTQVGPISAVAPVVTRLTTTYPQTVRLGPIDTSASPAGIATWTGPKVPLWQFVLDTYLKPLV